MKSFSPFVPLAFGAATWRGVRDCATDAGAGAVPMLASPWKAYGLVNAADLSIKLGILIGYG